MPCATAHSATLKKRSRRSPGCSTMPLGGRRDEEPPLARLLDHAERK